MSQAGERLEQFVIDVIDAVDVLKRAAGTAVPPVAGLPTVTLAEDGAPTITVPAGPPPTELLVTDLIVGAGEPVAENQTLTVPVSYTHLTLPTICSV